MKKLALVLVTLFAFSAVAFAEEPAADHEKTEKTEKTEKHTKHKKGHGKKEHHETTEKKTTEEAK